MVNVEDHKYNWWLLMFFVIPTYAYATYQRYKLAKGRKCPESSCISNTYVPLYKTSSYCYS